MSKRIKFVDSVEPCDSRFFKLSLSNVRMLRVIARDAISRHLNGEAVLLSARDLDCLYEFFQDTYKYYEFPRKDSTCRFSDAV